MSHYNSVKGDHSPITAEKLIRQPYNWTGLSAIELIAAGRVNKAQVIHELSESAIQFYFKPGENVRDAIKRIKEKREQFAHDISWELKDCINYV
jgi:methylmalonyl-CoA mutase cobalamin-binding subunit